MPDKSDVVVEQLDALKSDLQGLWVALTHDPKAQARKERAWAVLAGAAGAAATMLARKGAAKAWGVLTGEPPPTGAAAPRKRT